MGQNISPNFMFLIMLGNVWTPFTFKRPSQQCQSPNAPSFFKHFNKLVATCLFQLFILNKLLLHSSIIITFIPNPLNIFIEVELHILPIRQNLTHEKQSCLQLGHTQNILDMDLFVLSFTIISTKLKYILIASTMLSSSK